MGVKIREKPNGSGVWWVFINHHGKRKSKKIGDKKTTREVAEKINAKLILGELEVEKINSKLPLFKEISRTWFSLPHDWKESTHENYEQNLASHVYPVLGKKRIDTITRKDLKLFFDELCQKKGLSLSTIKAIRAPLSGVFTYAVDAEIIDLNPIRDIQLSYKKSKFEINPLDGFETVKLLDAAKIFKGGDYYPPMLCALRTGLRIGEMQGLQWRDVDFNERQIEVRRSWRKGRMTRTKNKKRRIVNMTLHLTDVLKKHHTAQKRRALKSGAPFSEFVFTGWRHEMMDRTSFQRAINQCTKNAGLRRVSTHSLRHSYATIRLMRGHNVGDVSYQLGHSSIKITYDTYCHWIPGRFKSEVDELDQPHPNAPYAHPDKSDMEKL